MSQPSDGTCTVRCLKPETVEAAETSLDGKAATTVAFICSLSHKEERITLISEEAAETLAGCLGSLGTARVVRILFALSQSELCQCDVATLVGGNEAETAALLANLRDHGLLKMRLIQGMNYYTVAHPALGQLLEVLLAETEG